MQLNTNLGKPEFRNSAGRLLFLLKLLQSQESYFGIIAKLYGLPAGIPTPESAANISRAFLAFMPLVTHAYEEFLTELSTSESIQEATRNIIHNGLSNVTSIVYSTNPASNPPRLSGSDVTVLQLAASMLDSEPELPPDDVQSIRDSLEELRILLEDSDLKPNARNALLELMRLSRNAIDYYSIYGARGFKKAFKKMLAELMELLFHEGEAVKNEEWWTKAVNHLRLIDKVASALLKYRPLLENITVLIGTI